MRGLIAALAAVLALTACTSGGEVARGPSPDKSGIESVSSRPVTGTLQSKAPATEILKQLPRVETGGTCAPRYRHGGGGACVNNRPCRGFGVRAPDGAILCSCYGDIGGCGERDRCDQQKLTCIPDETPPYQRAS